MRKFLFILALNFLTLVIHAQQENQYTQFPYLLANVNPAQAGAEDHLSVTVMNRNQWAGINGAPKTQLLSIELPSVLNSLGFGLNASRQTVGISEKIDVQGIYAYKISVKQHAISLGLQGSYRNQSQDFTKDELVAIQGFELDPSIERTRYSVSNFNLGFGVLWRSNKHSLGLSFPRMAKSNIDQPGEQDVTFSSEVRHAYLIGSYKFDLLSNWSYEPSILVKYAENTPTDLDVFSNFIYNEQLHLGMNVRAGGTSDSLFDSIALIFGLKLRQSILASVSYDFTTSQINEFENGSFELVLKYTLNKDLTPNKFQNPRYY